MALTLKIAVVGAVQSGKTVISNLLAENDLHNNEYDPTVGCRYISNVHDGSHSRFTP